MTGPDPGPPDVIEVDAAEPGEVVLVGSDTGPPRPLTPTSSVSAEVETLRSTAVAAHTLSGHRLITPSRDGLVYADPTEIDHLHAPLWLTLAAAAAGTAVPVLVHGATTETSWAWVAGPLYLGPQGRLTQSVPTAPDALFCAPVGAATAPTGLFLHRQPSIRLHH